MEAQLLLEEVVRSHLSANQNAVKPMHSVQLQNARQTTQLKEARPTILLVEDEMMVRDVTRSVLQHAGYCVLECRGPEEALRLARERKEKIQLLLADVVMPGMSGIELAQKLTDANPGLVTVFISGYPQLQLPQLNLHSCTGFIQKPFTIQALLSGVAKALRSNLVAEPVS